MAISTAEIKLMEEYTKDIQPPVKLVKNTKQTKKNTKKPAMPHHSLQFEKVIALAIIPIVIISFVFIYLSAYSDSLTREKAALENQIKCQSSESVRLEQTLNMKFSPQNIEKFAAENGMRKITGSQVIFVDFSDEDKIILYDDK